MAAVSQRLGDGGIEGAHSHCLLLFAPVQGREAQLAEVARWQKHTKVAQLRVKKRLLRKVSTSISRASDRQELNAFLNFHDAPILYNEEGARLL